MEEKIKAVKKYIESVIDWWSIPQGMYGSHEDKRRSAHDAVIEQYDCNPMDLKLITDNLDIWIGIPLDRGNMPEVSNTQINQYTLKLHNILESKKFKEGGYVYVSDETKRLRKLWWDN